MRDKDYNPTPSIGGKHSIMGILIRATQELEVMYHMSKRLGISGSRLTIYAKSCIEGSMLGEIQHPYQVKDLMKIETIPIGRV